MIFIIFIICITYVSYYIQDMYLRNVSKMIFIIFIICITCISCIYKICMLYAYCVCCSLKVYVLKRPYVEEFLQKMGELFECVLFTASLGKVSLVHC